MVNSKMPYMKELQISKSKKLIKLQIISVSFVAFLLVLASFLVLRGARSVLGIDATTFGWVLRFLVVATALLAVYITSLHDKNKVYTLKDSKLIISNSVLGSKSRETILKIAPNAVSGISLRQSHLEKILGIGTIVISIDSFSGKKTHRLVGVDDPDKIIDWLDESFAQKQ